MNILKTPTNWDEIKWYQYEQISKMDTFKEQFRYLFGIDYADVNFLDAPKFSWFLTPPNIEGMPPISSFEHEGVLFKFLGGKDFDKNSIGFIPLGVIADCHHDHIRKDQLAVVCCLFWKEGEKYSEVIENFDERKKMLSRLNFTTILKIASFFFVLLQIIAAYSRTSLKKKQETIG